MATSRNSFETRTTLDLGDRKVDYFSLPRLEARGFPVGRLPYSLKILLENLLRHEDGLTVEASDIEALGKWDVNAGTVREIAFMPARVLLQDFTGVPAVVDLAAMRDAMAALGGDPQKINPLLPSELVIDHSVQVDSFGRADSMAHNAKLEFARNEERYAFLRWGQTAFNNFSVVPPDTGIVHQVNIEYLARVIFDAQEAGGATIAYPDSVVGTDSHTTMVNGLAVLGWGVGGIEAEAAMLGQPISMLVPEVIGFKLVGTLLPGATATDLVLTVTQMLRAKGVVGKFVEFYGDGLSGLTLADRATLGNMAPEYGATCAIFPIDDETLKYLRFTGRDDARVRLVEAYAKEQGLFRAPGSSDPVFTSSLELDLSTVVPSLAGPKRPQDRVRLDGAKTAWNGTVASLRPKTSTSKDNNQATAKINLDGSDVEISDGAVVIAAITSCTNTSNPDVMIGAGLLAKKAVERGLQVKPWVKTSLAPGSKVVTEYLAASGLDKALNALKFNLVGYGCTTCIGNSGPLPEAVSEGIKTGGLVAVSVLSGNRNFEGRINPDVRANYLASPPLVVAYAIAGRMDVDLYNDPLGQDQNGQDVFLKDIWPTRQEVTAAVGATLTPEMFSSQYAEVFKGDEAWQSLEIPTGDRFTWDDASTYVRHPTFFTGMSADPAPLADISGARVLLSLGDSVTTDHISPAGSIAKNSPAAEYLGAHGVDPKDFNSYGSRRGNHEVMVRGTFANVRLRNELAPGTEGGWTRHLPDGEQTSVYDAAMKYAADGVPLMILAGKEYGSGSSRDWAAKGTALLGVRAVIAESYERIHRSNLIGMGILPMQFPEGQGRKSLGLTGEETLRIDGIATGLAPRKSLSVTAISDDGKETTFEALTRIDTPVELEYYRHGGILKYVLRQLASS